MAYNRKERQLILVQDICEDSSGKVVLIQVNISEAVEVEPGRFQTVLTHPSLSGELVLHHGKDRNLLLNAITVDLKNFDPVSSLFRHLVEWKKES